MNFKGLTDFREAPLLVRMNLWMPAVYLHMGEESHNDPLTTLCGLPMC